MERSRPEEGMDPLKIGKLRYRAGDYDGALIAFTDVIRTSTGPFLLAALDHRAATYEKLGSLKNALKDSKQMIDIKPEDAKGYLRCSKVLQLRGETDLAQKIFERGLIKVKLGTDPERANLERLYNRFIAAKGPKPSFNPLLMLPLELAQMVCSYLDVCDKVACLRVHSSWKKFFDSTHELWDTLDTTTVKRPISEEGLKRHLQRSKFTLHSAILRVIPTGFNVKKMKYLTRTCQKLSYLEMQQGMIGETLLASLPTAKGLRTLILTNNARITLAAVVLTLASLKNLTVAEFHNVDPGDLSYVCRWIWMDRLRKLVLINSMKAKSEVNALDFHKLMECTPKLKVAQILGWDCASGRSDAVKFCRWGCLEELNLGGTQLQRIDSLPQTLRILDLSKMWALKFLHFMLYKQTEGPVLPSLVSFAFTGTQMITIEMAFMALETSIKGNHLTKLECGSIMNYEVSKFKEIEGLEEICLSCCQESEETILAILAKYPKLKRVDLSSTKVTGVTVKEMMTKQGGPVEWLNLNDCMAVSPDAIYYARSRGCHVERKFKTPVRSYRDLAV